MGNILHSSSFLKPAPTFKFQATPRKGLEAVKGRKTIEGGHKRSVTKLQYFEKDSEGIRMKTAYIKP